MNVLESAEELREKGLAFSDEAKRELSVLSAAVNDILMRALDAFRQQDMTAARQVEPLEQVIDDLKEQLRTRHILRMQQGQCSIEAGFVWSDLLTVFSYLDHITLYEYSSGSGATASMVPLSLGDLMGALLIVAFTVVLAGNLPGLLEVLVLSRLQLAQGSSLQPVPR